MALSDLPGRWITKRLSGWLHPYAEAVGTWQLGATQIYIGVAILALPVQPLNASVRMMWWRVATGWCAVLFRLKRCDVLSMHRLMIAMGVVNAFLGQVAWLYVRSLPLR